MLRKSDLRHVVVWCCSELLSGRQYLVALLELLPSASALTFHVVVWTASLPEHRPCWWQLRWKVTRVLPSANPRVARTGPLHSAGAQR